MFLLKHTIEWLTDWITDQVMSYTTCENCGQKLIVRVRINLNGEEPFLKVAVEPHKC
jgi:DNA-directed RNA polymerase subunit RPC12/RpoP